MGKFHSAPFIAWDGEGATLRSRHRLILLASSAGDELVAARGASSDAWLTCLWRGLVARPDAIHVGFAFSYDVNMMLHSLPRPVAAELWDTGAVQWNGWRIRYRPHKEFAVARLQGARWVGGTVWDVFGFFQSSFVSALESYQVGFPSERAHIRRMKAERSRFHPRQLPRIRAYTQTELRLLVRLMDLVRSYAQDVGLTLRRWDGAGAVAADFFRMHGVLDHLGPDPAYRHPRFPEAVRDAGQFAYFGGRIEALQVGHHQGRIYQYDIRSAYPDAMRHLPSLHPERGAWTQTRTFERRVKLAVYRVRWALSRGPGAALEVFPFPWRAVDGAVYFPPEGEGWVWAPEVHLALSGLRSGQLAGRVDILDGWAWHERPGPAPFGFIPEMFQLRAAWKKAGNGAEKVLKLGLNSLYGKMAQQLGGSAIRAPRYHSMELAGFVTSWVRARVTRAAWRAQGGAIMLATDAIYSTVPLGLEGEGLGSWEKAEHESGTFVQSGVYWVGQEGGELHHYRGFDPGSLIRAQVLQGWARGRPAISGKSERLVTLGRAVSSEHSFKSWGQWVRTPRRLALYPAVGQKRGLPPGVWRPKLDAGLVATVATQPTKAESCDGKGLSSPVNVPWRPLPGVSPVPLLPLRAEAEEALDLETGT